MFAFWDDTIDKLLPDATVKFAPLIASGQKQWLTEGFFQDSFKEINRLVRERDHVNFDSFEPLRKNMLMDQVHMKEKEGIDFWKRIFKQL